MKIAIKSILPEGLEIAGHIASEVIGLTAQSEGHFTAPLDVQATVSRTNNTILVKTHLCGRYKSVCSRCMVEVEQRWGGDFLFDFLVDKQTEFVDLSEDIRQEVLLGLPQKILCRQDCKGICLNCGADLNNEKCKCDSGGSLDGDSLRSQ